MSNEVFAFLLGAVFSLMVCGLVLWLLLKLAREKVYAEAETAKAILEERLQAHERQSQSAERQIAPLREGMASLQCQLMAETERRVVAEERNTRIPHLEADLDSKTSDLAAMQSRTISLLTEQEKLKTTMEEERKSAAEKLTLIDEAQRKLGDAFKALSAEALLSNNQSFLDLAKSALQTYQESAKGDLEKRQQAIAELIKPIGESLVKVDGKIAEMEKERTVAYTSLTEQVKSLATTQVQLQSETANLVKALRAPHVRGRWGEIQLQRVVEMAGMVEHCDFLQQESVTTEHGRRLRPDLIVRLPGGKNVVVDAKCPLQAYLDALDASDNSARTEALARHARQLETHVKQLGAKNYPARHQPGPEFVVLFLPNEAIFAAALEQDPGLIEKALVNNVVLATPTTLIALLRTIAQGWRENALADNARRISELGRRLHERLGTMTSHLNRLGRALGSSVDAYNKTIGSFETRVLTDARRFAELGAVQESNTLERPLDIEISPRPPTTNDREPRQTPRVPISSPIQSESSDSAEAYPNVYDNEEASRDSDDFMMMPDEMAPPP